MVSLSLAESAEGMLAIEWPSCGKSGMEGVYFSTGLDIRRSSLAVTSQEREETLNLHQRHNQHSLCCILKPRPKQQTIWGRGIFEEASANIERNVVLLIAFHGRWSAPRLKILQFFAQDPFQMQASCVHHTLMHDEPRIHVLHIMKIHTPYKHREIK